MRRCGGAVVSAWSWPKTLTHNSTKKENIKHQDAAKDEAQMEDSSEDVASDILDSTGESANNAIPPKENIDGMLEEYTTSEAEQAHTALSRETVGMRDTSLPLSPIEEEEATTSDGWSTCSAVTSSESSLPDSPRSIDTGFQSELPDEDEEYNKVMYEVNKLVLGGSDSSSYEEHCTNTTITMNAPSSDSIGCFRYPTQTPGEQRLNEQNIKKAEDRRLKLSHDQPYQGDSLEVTSPDPYVNEATDPWSVFVSGVNRINQARLPSQLKSDSHPSVTVAQMNSNAEKVRSILTKQYDVGDIGADMSVDSLNPYYAEEVQEAELTKTTLAKDIEESGAHQQRQSASRRDHCSASTPQSEVQLPANESNFNGFSTTSRASNASATAEDEALDTSLVDLPAHLIIPKNSSPAATSSPIFYYSNANEEANQIEFNEADPPASACNTVRSNIVSLTDWEELEERVKLLQEEKIRIAEQMRVLQEENGILAEQKVLYKKTIDDLSTEFRAKTKHLCQEVELLNKRKEAAERELKLCNARNEVTREKLDVISEAHAQLERKYNQLCEESKHKVDAFEHKRQMAEMKTEKNTEINRLISENDSLRSMLYSAHAENDRLSVSITDHARDSVNNIPNFHNSSMEAAKVELKLTNKLLECQWSEMKVKNIDNKVCRMKNMINDQDTFFEHEVVAR